MDGRLRGERRHGPTVLRLSYSQAAPAEMRGHVREVSGLFTPEQERGKGFASHLLSKTCAEADANQLVLVIQPDTPELAEWYQNFGFQLLQKAPIFMARPINAPKLVKLKATLVH